MNNNESDTISYDMKEYVVRATASTISTKTAYENDVKYVHMRLLIIS